jgi:hypothetical protein
VKTKDFITRLREAPEKWVTFDDADGPTIHPGFDLTELKAASFDTIGFAGQKKWNETIVLLCVPEDEESEECMTAQKFLATFDKCAGSIPLDAEAEIRFEYGDENFPTLNYFVEGISEDENELRVRLRAPPSTCKTQGRGKSGTTYCV